MKNPQAPTTEPQRSECRPPLSLPSMGASGRSEGGSGCFLVPATQLNRVCPASCRWRPSLSDSYEHVLHSRKNGNVHHWTSHTTIAMIMHVKLLLLLLYYFNNTNYSSCHLPEVLQCCIFWSSENAVFNLAFILSEISDSWTVRHLDMDVRD